MVWSVSVAVFVKSSSCQNVKSSKLLRAIFNPAAKYSIEMVNDKVMRMKLIINAFINVSKTRIYRRKPMAGVARNLLAKLVFKAKRNINGDQK